MADLGFGVLARTRASGIQHKTFPVSEREKMKKAEFLGLAAKEMKGTRNEVNVNQMTSILANGAASRARNVSGPLGLDWEQCKFLGEKPRTVLAAACSQGE
ncbi:hypothetical protein E5288_WYG000264 [Bos mutus]|uniref:Uncharacterized protein n=1 Tax=Bos mutus TaxID=72004 RepID=A0A6B0QUG4_9CETA|nr:hypothetical protein [Bos mutus]